MGMDVAFLATGRFGLGPRPGELVRVANDPKGWLDEQVRAPQAPKRLGAFPDTPALLKRVGMLMAERKDAKQDAKPGQDRLRQIYIAEAAARTWAAVDSRTPFVERLVHFWGNHFTVSATRPRIAPLAGAFEREAIRPHVLGRFRELLDAAVRHPAMLYYLDNAESIGPNSPTGGRRQKGLNENLARELLELHTLGVDGGYAQADVEQLARILTGWTVGRGDKDKTAGGALGRFHFAPRLHEPGGKTLLGTVIAEGGEAEGRDALDLLARHPATARHVARKLVRHFIADDPPSAAVDALTKTFLDSDGDLAALARALIARPEAWRNPLAKVKTPNEFVISVLRATGYEAVEDRRLVHVLGLMGQDIFAAPSPAGWPDTAAAWISPEALMRRLEWSRDVARGLFARTVDSARVIETAFGPLMSPVTRQTLNMSTDKAETLFLAFAAPEFQRR